MGPLPLPFSRRQRQRYQPHCVMCLEGNIDDFLAPHEIIILIPVMIAKLITDDIISCISDGVWVWFFDFFPFSRFLSFLFLPFSRFLWITSFRNHVPHKRRTNYMYVSIGHTEFSSYTSSNSEISQSNQETKRPKLLLHKLIATLMSFKIT